MHFFKKLPCAYPKLGDSVEERKGKEQKHNQPLSADGRRRFVVGPGSFLGRVDVFNFFFFFCTGFCTRWPASFIIWLPVLDSYICASLEW